MVQIWWSHVYSYYIIVISTESKTDTIFVHVVVVNMLALKHLNCKWYATVCDLTWFDWSTELQSWCKHIEGWELEGRGEPQEQRTLQESHNKNVTIVCSDFLYLFHICIYNTNVYTHGRQYFASWKSLLRAFIWCIYLNFTKNVTEALLVLTPSTSLWSDAFLNALMFSHRFQLFVYCALKRIVHSTYLLAESIPQLIQVFQTSKQRTKNNSLWVNQGLNVPLPVLFPITRKCVAITITNSYIQLKG